MRFSALGDAAVRIDFGKGPAGLTRAAHFSLAWRNDMPAGVHDVVAAYSQVAVYYDPAKFSTAGNSPHEAVCELLRTPRGVKAPSRLRRLRRAPLPSVEIPLCCDGEFAPDLEAWAAHCELSLERALKLYLAQDYIVGAVGFAPGFPYLSGLSEKLFMPRRATPRPSVPAGSVGIGGRQTGIYPFPTPGGWNLVGRTPLRMFDLERESPALLQVGDRVHFRRITVEEFSAWK